MYHCINGSYSKRFTFPVLLVLLLFTQTVLAGGGSIPRQEKLAGAALFDLLMDHPNESFENILQKPEGRQIALTSGAIAHAILGMDASDLATRRQEVTEWLLNNSKHEYLQQTTDYIESSSRYGKQSALKGIVAQSIRPRLRQMAKELLKGATRQHSLMDSDEDERGGPAGYSLLDSEDEDGDTSMEVSEVESFRDVLPVASGKVALHRAKSKQKASLLMSTSKPLLNKLNVAGKWLLPDTKLTKGQKQAIVKWNFLPIIDLVEASAGVAFVDLLPVFSIYTPAQPRASYLRQLRELSGILHKANIIPDLPPEYRDSIPILLAIQQARIDLDSESASSGALQMLQSLWPEFRDGFNPNNQSLEKLWGYLYDVLDLKNLHYSKDDSVKKESKEMSLLTAENAVSSHIARFAAINLEEPAAILSEVVRLAAENQHHFSAQDIFDLSMHSGMTLYDLYQSVFQKSLFEHPALTLLEIIFKPQPLDESDEDDELEDDAGLPVPQQEVRTAFQGIIRELTDLNDIDALARACFYKIGYMPEGLVEGFKRVSLQSQATAAERMDTSTAAAVPPSQKPLEILFPFDQLLRSRDFDMMKRRIQLTDYQQEQSADFKNRLGVEYYLSSIPTKEAKRKETDDILKLWLKGKGTVPIKWTSLRNALGNSQLKTKMTAHIDASRYAAAVGITVTEGFMEQPELADLIDLDGYPIVRAIAATRRNDNGMFHKMAVNLLSPFADCGTPPPHKSAMIYTESLLQKWLHQSNEDYYGSWMYLLTVLRDSGYTSMHLVADNIHKKLLDKTE